MNKRLWILGIIMALGTSALVQAADPPMAKPQQPAAQPSPPPDMQVHRDLEYVPGGHARNKLDLYLPAKAEHPLPVIVWIHGGGWEGGGKEDCHAVPLVGKGYAVASINYRLSQHALFPAQIEDCKAAIRWLRANAKKYSLDPDHIGVWGFGRRAPGRPAGHHRRREGVRRQGRQPRPVQPCPVRRRFLRADRNVDDGQAGR